MKKLLSILAIALLMCTNIKAQDTTTLALNCDLYLEGQSSELNIFHIAITDDESNEVTFDAKQSFSCELNMNHTYTVIIKSDDHTARFLNIDTYGNITQKMTYHYKASLIKWRTNKDIIVWDIIKYDSLSNKFCKK